VEWHGYKVGRLKQSGLLPRGGFTSREGFEYLEAVAERELQVAGQPLLPVISPKVLEVGFKFRPPVEPMGAQFG